MTGSFCDLGAISSSVSPISASTTPSTPPSTSSRPHTLAAFPSAPKNAMAASTFIPHPPSLQHSPAMITPAYPPATHAFDRDQSLAVGGPVGPVQTSLLIGNLPPNSTEELLRAMFLFSKDFVNVELLPSESPSEEGHRRAVATFRTANGAFEARTLLQGSKNSPGDGEITLDVLSHSVGASTNGRRLHGDAPISTPAAPVALSATSSSAPSRQASHFNGAGLGTLESISPPMNPVHAAFGNGDLSAHEAHAVPVYKNIFHAESLIGNHLGNHLADPMRMSGKSLIKNDGGDDEDAQLLNDVYVNGTGAYSDGGSMPHQARRATAPNIGIARSMTTLSLNTNGHSMGPYGPAAKGPMSAHVNALSPNMGSMNFMPATSYPLRPVPDRMKPPPNPADMNPPCNTLYVGNLPLQTSEEELKAIFCKQRGYKRLCFRTKQNGPMCFVEFDDITCATKCLNELYGVLLTNSVKGGIRLSFSKNPLGVRSNQNQQNGGPGGPGSSPGGGGGGGLHPLTQMNGMMSGSSAYFASASGPPPGLSAPPGLHINAANRAANAYPSSTQSHGYNSHAALTPSSMSAASFSGLSPFSPSTNMWGSPSHVGAMTAGGPSPGSTNFGSANYYHLAK